MMLTSRLRTSAVLPAFMRLPRAGARASAAGEPTRSRPWHATPCSRFAPSGVTGAIRRSRRVTGGARPPVTRRERRIAPVTPDGAKREQGVACQGRERVGSPAALARAPARGSRMNAGKTADVLSLDVSIMGREYRVVCKPGERQELLDAVAYVDRQMREIR